ncbi:glycosyltransferase [Neolewinella aurantiaca]|uniref:Glycosyltransferase n=1 Tax=Neolewinella aurantiaca TaxID=2602767 RepID=A0A5C7FIH7_9BACT|nr:glycosyltransferase [Neolewinella aurantiaca]TXF90953.1 glycosyltransferase [Neolewinella aurantiaca]
MNQQRKKVLFIHHGSAYGGAPMSLLYTALGIKEHGYEPFVAMVQPSDDLRKLYNDNGIETFELSGFPRYFFWSSDNYRLYYPIAIKKILGAASKYTSGREKLFLLLDSLKPDIVHLNSVTLVAAVSMMRGRTEELVWHIREYGPKYKDFRWKYIQKQMMATEKVIYLSEGERKSWIERSDHGIVVNNFVNVNDFSAPDHRGKEKSILGVENCFTLLYVGGLKKNKGPELLLETLNNLKKRGHKVKCLMPGAVTPEEARGETIDAYASFLIERINELKLNDVCVRSPFSSDIRAFFVAADVLLFPAIFPHFARPVIEASAMKIPVVVSNLEPLDELVIDNETGFLAELSAESFSDKLERLIKDPSLRTDMGLRGRKFALSHFDAEQQIRKIANYYEG